MQRFVLSGPLTGLSSNLPLLEQVEDGKTPYAASSCSNANGTATNDTEVAESACGETGEVTHPFLDFAQDVHSQTVLRASITAAYRRPEPESVPFLIGHGLQRTLVITLLQSLADAQAQVVPGAALAPVRANILLIEEPELYLHPQMERLMRDVLYRLAEQASTQVACCTHSPVFLDIATKYRAIVRMFKTPQGDEAAHQVTHDLFPGQPLQADRQRLNTVARFDPTVNELFFAKRVVLMEEFSAIAAFERGAELMGLFERHLRLRREVSLVDCNGKSNVPAFQRVLNAFNIPYRVLHDEDPGNPAEQASVHSTDRLAESRPRQSGSLLQETGQAARQARSRREPARAGAVPLRAPGIWRDSIRARSIFRRRTLRSWPDNRPRRIPAATDGRPQYS